MVPSWRLASEARLSGALLAPSTRRHLWLSFEETDGRHGVISFRFYDAARACQGFFSRLAGIGLESKGGRSAAKATGVSNQALMGPGSNVATVEEPVLTAVTTICGDRR